MINLKRTTSTDEDFRSLVSLLDRDLAIRDGADHSFYNQFNKIDNINTALVYYEDGKPVGCGAFKEFDGESVEIKRMFVLPDFRGKGIAAEILSELENWAAELNYTTCVLETGIKQPEAIRLYQKSGYQLIPNYGQYEGVATSVCFRRKLRQI